MSKKNLGFSRYGLHERVLVALPGLGFHHPTAVQDKVIPAFLAQRNLIVEAPTGTGKTAAYGMPLISQLNLLKRSTQALVLAPSRELARQIAEALLSFFEGDTLKVGLVTGGGSVEDSFLEIKSGPHIVVAVPGRLREISAQYQYDYLWRDIKYLIVDEGDKLLEAGFQKDFDEIRKHLRPNLHVGFFSATISADAEKMMKELAPRASLIRLAPRDLLRNLSFFEVEVPRSGREAGLAALLATGQVDRALIFCSRRSEIFPITGFLLNQGFRTEAYYGAQTAEERSAILEGFREGRVQYLVASDLAARGLDLIDLPSVVNLWVPEAYDHYLHRAGRTGRAGKPGKVWSLATTEAEQIYLHNHHEAMGLPLKQFQIKAQAKKAQPVVRWVKCHLSRGKRDKVRRGDVAGFILNQAGIDPAQIGVITVFEAYSVVTLPEPVMATLEKTDDLRLKGKSVKARRYTWDEQEQIAQATKQLLRDRKPVKKTEGRAKKQG
jgi:ATP-independent RNA helicase DbpA